MKLGNFEEFCINPNVDSGKAKSYALSIKYLCDFMHIDIETLSKSDACKIFAIVNDVRKKDSDFYKQFLSYLAKGNKKSYLSGGFVSAALNYFKDYCTIVLHF